MSSPHGTSTASLPLKISNLKCACPDRKVAERLCLGCYKYFCSLCYQEHRRKLSAEFDYRIHESDIVLQAINETVTQNPGVQIFDPTQLRRDIYDCHQKLINKVDLARRRALQALKKIMDERSDQLIAGIDPIRVNTNSSKELQQYAETHSHRFKEELRTVNEKIEENLKISYKVNINGSNETEWQPCIEVQQQDRTEIRKIRTTEVAQDPKFEHLTKGHGPFKELNNQGKGCAIAASEHQVIFVRNNDELCLVEAHADYRTIIPLNLETAGNNQTDFVVDLSWSSAINSFVVLTCSQLLILNPYRKIPLVVPNISPPSERRFQGCCCSGAKLFICYTGTASPINHWSTTDWKYEKSWDSPISCATSNKISCMRFNLSSSLLGITFSDNRRNSDIFEVRDVRSMTCIWSQKVPATYCVGLISFDDNRWLVGIFNYHKIFLVDRTLKDPQELKMTDPSKSSLRGMTLVNQGTVVVRSAETVIFFDLFN